MRLRVLLLLAALFFIHVPISAQAQEIDTPMCGTLPKWWWNKNGLFGKVDIRNWNVQQVGRGFLITFDAVNITDSLLDTGPVFTLSHAAVDPAGYRDPSSLTLPEDPRSILGTEALVQARLPSLRPGQSVTLRAEAEAFREDANHILTFAIQDEEQVRFTAETGLVPWFWLRVLQPDERNAQLRAVATSVEPAPSRIPGYEARRVRVTLQNVGSVPRRRNPCGHGARQRVVRGWQLGPGR